MYQKCCILQNNVMNPAVKVLSSLKSVKFIGNYQSSQIVEN